MTTFNVTAIVKDKQVTISVDAVDAIAAIREARNILGYEMRGTFFPLHWSEIKKVVRA